MLRLVLSAIVLVGAVAAAKPTLADPTNVTMPDREQARLPLPNRPLNQPRGRRL
jgi:hypothetical protein